MKKLVVLVTLMVAVFGFSAGAFAAFGDPICLSCKGPLRNVPIYTAAEQTTLSCTDFDYDMNSSADGYCEYKSNNNYRLIFAVCNCELSQAAKLVDGFRVAIRMEILVNGQSGARGAYWSGPAVTNIIFNNYLTQSAACAATVAEQTKTFGAPVFYLADGATSVPTLVTDPTCTVPDDQKSTILRTPQGAAAGYLITLADVNLAYWWIDVPPIRIDPAAVTAGDVISVKVSLYDATLQPVCPDCVVPICECTIDVARVGCTSSSTSSLTFPYFTSLTAGDYWNGIVIANPNSEAGSCDLTAYEIDGSVGTATVAVPAKSMFVNTLESMTWTGSGLGDVACYIKASCNYGGAFGFFMMSNGTASMGTKVP